MSGYCAYCGAWTPKLTRDHIKPRVRGGTDEAGNIALVCQSCNSRKGAKEVTHWVGVMNSVQEQAFAYD